MSRKEDGSILFEKMYESLYKDRWPQLRDALLKKSTPKALDDWNEKPYYMDEASIVAANLLPIKDGDRILDMCAAPGGKSLVLALKMGSNSSLICNDRSASRRNRLHKVLNDHVIASVRERITVTSHDASKWALYEKDTYDAILLDAPCSSERHVLQDPSYLTKFSKNRTKMLSIQQFAMLCSALDAVKIGGYILYSTCSIHSGENEEVIAKLEKKREGRYSVEPLDDFFGEPLSYGKIILPDVNNNLGPLYVCLLRRLG